MASPASAHPGPPGPEVHHRGPGDGPKHGHGHGEIVVAPPVAVPVASPEGHPHGPGPDGPESSCDHPDFTSINDAVAAAPTGGTVVVCPGTYTEDVLVNKALHLRGHDATIDATGLENAIWVVASDVRVDGFTLENANGEGLLAGIDSLADIGELPAAGPVLTHVVVEHNQVINNDKGVNGTEQGNCKYPGDCGAGIHFNVTTLSVMKHNTVTGNADGVLLTDDYGPSSYNLVDHNTVNDNLHECGIVLPSHNPGAVTFDPNTLQVTGRNPEVGGVYGNVIVHNRADGNGTDQAPIEFGGGGSGSGIGLFASTSGTAVYDNIVADNEASGNGLAGIAMHAHTPGGEDINGNVLVHNKLGTNNIGGDGFDGPPTMDFETTGIAIFSMSPAHMVISDNKIHDDTIGVWLSSNITADGLDHNHYKNVTTPVVVG